MSAIKADLKQIVTDPEFQSESPAVQQSILESIDPEYAATFAASQQPQAPAPTFTERIGQSYEQRQQNVEDIYSRSGESPLEKVWNSPKTAVLAAGQAAGLVDDAVAEMIVSAWNNLAPESFKNLAKEQLGEFADTKLGKEGLDALSRGLAAYETFSKNYPDAAKAIEALLNFTAVGLAKSTRKQAMNALADANTLASNTRIAYRDLFSSLPWTQRVTNKVRNSISSIIDLRSAGGGKRLFKKQLSYLDDAENAVREIVANKGNMRFTDYNGKVAKNLLPNNKKTAVIDMAQAIDQTKRNIWTEVEQAMQSADIAGIKINPSDAITNIQRYISSPSILSKPDAKAIIDKGNEMIKYYQSLPDFSVFDAQKIIRDRNKILDSTKRFIATSISDTDMAGLYAAELSGLNKNFRDAIGEAGTEAMRRYGTLSAIEDDISDLIVTRTAGRGVDYAAVFSTMEAIKAATGHGFNPSALGVSHVVASIEKATKRANSVISDMFNFVEKETLRHQPLASQLKSTGETITAIGGPMILTGGYSQEAKQQRKRIAR